MLIQVEWMRGTNSEYSRRGIFLSVCIRLEDAFKELEVKQRGKDLGSFFERPHKRIFHPNYYYYS